MHLLLIGQNRPSFIGSLGLFRIHFDRLMANAQYTTAPTNSDTDRTRMACTQNKWWMLWFGVCTASSSPMPKHCAAARRTCDSVGWRPSVTSRRPTTASPTACSSVIETPLPGTNTSSAALRYTTHSSSAGLRVAWQRLPLTQDRRVIVS
jgi:hypothetical protein